MGRRSRAFVPDRRCARAAPQQLAQLLHAGWIDLVEVEQFLISASEKTGRLPRRISSQPRAVVCAVEPRQSWRRA